MPRINLLPWRDELRAERRNQFYMAMGAAFGVAAVVVLIGVMLMNALKRLSILSGRKIV